MDVDSLPEELTEYLDTFFFLTIAVLLAFGSLQTAGTVLNTERPVVSVVSCSMYPALNVGDILLVQGTEFEDIEEGDIAIYQVDKQAILNIEDERIELDSNNSAAQTAAGKVELIDAISNDDGRAILKIDGENIELDVGETAIVNGERISLVYAAGMEIPVVHRVVDKHETYLETKGDNNPRQIPFEKEVRPEQIYGVSRLTIPRIGGFKLLLMDFLGMNNGQPIIFDTYPVCKEAT